MIIRGMSRLAMGVTLTVALSLALFLTLLLLLLADIFCTHLRRRRGDGRGGAFQPKCEESPPHTGTGDDASAVTTQEAALANTPPFYYAHGVMQAPKDLLLAIPKLEAAMATPPPLAMAAPAAAMPPVWQWSPARRSSSASISSIHSDHFVRISNPVYERSGVMAAAGGTPFETPDTSPSHLGIGGEEEDDGEYSPPLAAMKKLPQMRFVACPAPALISFVDGRQSLTGSATATDTNRASSSSSNTHCFSVSW